MFLKFLAAASLTFSAVGPSHAFDMKGFTGGGGSYRSESGCTVRTSEVPDGDKGVAFWKTAEEAATVGWLKTGDVQASGQAKSWMLPTPDAFAISHAAREGDTDTSALTAVFLRDGKVKKYGLRCTSGSPEVETDFLYAVYQDIGEVHLTPPSTGWSRMDGTSNAFKNTKACEAITSATMTGTMQSAFDSLAEKVVTRLEGASLTTKPTKTKGFSGAFASFSGKAGGVDEHWGAAVAASTDDAFRGYLLKCPTQEALKDSWPDVYRWAERVANAGK